MRTFVVEQISFLIYRVVVVIQQQKPHWLTPKYRNFDFREVQVDFIEKLTARLDDLESKETLIFGLVRFLRKLFVPDFFKGQVFSDLLQRVHLLLSQAPELQSDHPNILASMDGNGKAGGEAIAILLVDAENIGLTIEGEKFLQSICQFPIQIKIAFANWRNSNMTKRDLALHKRGYQLVHVPTGKNSADLQMTAIGSSIFIHYPTAKEIVICSSDPDLNHLSNILRTRGLAVYSVVKQGKSLVISNYTTGAVETHFPTGSGVSSGYALEQEITRILKDLTQTLPGTYISISTLSTQFKQLHGQSVTEVMKDLNLGSKYIKFLQTCSDLKLRLTDNGWQVALHNDLFDA